MESIAIKILNFKELEKIEHENSLVKDETEKNLRNKLIEDIFEKITDYDTHIFEYKYTEHINNLTSRGIIFNPIKKETAEKTWDTSFAAPVSENNKKMQKHYNDQYKWHIFSFGLLPAKVGINAKKAFDSNKETELYVFFQYSDEAYCIKNANLLKSSDFDFLGEFSTADKSDMYIFNTSASWTYIKTHEDSCGPYFFSK